MDSLPLSLWVLNIVVWMEFEALKIIQTKTRILSFAPFRALTWNAQNANLHRIAAYAID